MQRSLTFTFCSKLAALQHNTEYGSSHWSKKLIQRQIDAFVRSSLKTQMDILFQTRILIRVLNKFSAKKHNKKWCSFYIFFPSNVKAHKLEASFWAYESSSWERIDQNLIWTSHWWWALLYTHDFFASSESSDCWSAANANYYILKSRPKSVQKEHFHLMGRKYSL